MQYRWEYRLLHSSIISCSYSLTKYPHAHEIKIHVPKPCILHLLDVTWLPFATKRGSKMSWPPPALYETWLRTTCDTIWIMSLLANSCTIEGLDKVIFWATSITLSGYQLSWGIPNRLIESYMKDTVMKPAHLCCCYEMCTILEWLRWYIRSGKGKPRL